MATTARVLLCLGATFLTLAGISAAPRRYDQRQQGELNVHAQLENLLFVITIPSNNDVLSELALQALDLKQHLDTSGRVGIQPSSSKDHESNAWPSTTFKEPNEEIRGEEIYITTAETVQTNEDRPDQKDPSQQSAGGKDVSDTSSQQQQATTAASTGGKAREEKAESVARVAKSVSFEPTKIHRMPVILGYLVDTRQDLGSKVEDSGRARNVVGNVWNPDVELGRPGILMKKQLFRRGLYEEDVDKKEATLVGGEQQELRLLGDAIENCGPGRRRDASGVCVFDESDESLF